MPGTIVGPAVRPAFSEPPAFEVAAGDTSWTVELATSPDLMAPLWGARKRIHKAGNGWW